MDNGHITALAVLAHRAGFGGSNVRDPAILQAVAVSMTANPDANPALVTGSRYGLWQVFAAEAALHGITDPNRLLDASTNAETAHAIYTVSGWQQWPEYGSAAYQANAASVAKLAVTPAWSVVGGSSFDPSTILKPLVNIFKGASGGTTGVLDAGKTVVSGITGMFSNVELIGEGILGALLAVALVFVGLYLLGHMAMANPVREG
jgi:hypothetical protein